MKGMLSCWAPRAPLLALMLSAPAAPTGTRVVEATAEVLETVTLADGVMTRLDMISLANDLEQKMMSTYVVASTEVAADEEDTGTAAGWRSTGRQEKSSLSPTVTCGLRNY